MDNQNNSTNEISFEDQFDEKMLSRINGINKELKELQERQEFLLKEREWERNEYIKTFKVGDGVYYGKPRTIYNITSITSNPGLGINGNVELFYKVYIVHSSNIDQIQKSKGEVIFNVDNVEDLIKVTKGVNIINSSYSPTQGLYPLQGMCSSCGREEYLREMVGGHCGMNQPNGKKCCGVIKGVG